MKERGVPMRMQSYTIIFAILIVTTVSMQSNAAVVTPMIGGGQVKESMIHVDIFYDHDTNTMSATADTSHGIPELRPLSSGDEFDPAAPWSVLSGKAYNYQYGWNPGGFFVLPEGGRIWI